jgi:uncharacterized GH25 family protein
MIFELVPVKSPYASKTLDVRLMFDGAPLKNSMISSGDTFKTETDSKGMATIPILKSGWQVVMAKHIVRLSPSADADYQQYMTFFVFKVTP